MKLKIMAVGPLEENCYIVYDETTRQAILIDPGDEAERIVASSIKKTSRHSSSSTPTATGTTSAQWPR